MQAPTDSRQTAISVPSASQYEDAAMKMVLQFFADELLPFFGIKERAVRIVPTELIHMEIRKFYQDFNLEMEDGSWAHFEFQSTNEGLKGLKRFRSYEALASYQHNVAITTYVLYSGSIRHPMTSFTEGVNVYRIVPVIMQNYDADQLFRELLQKRKAGLPISRQALVQLTLCPLMAGSMSQKDRIKTAYEITQNADSVSAEDLKKIEAVIYAMAEKFLDSISMEEIKENMKMTRMGQMLVNDGFIQGEKAGIEKAQLDIAKSLIGLLDEQVIAERIGLSLETVQKLKAQLASANTDQ